MNTFIRIIRKPSAKFVVDFLKVFLLDFAVMFFNGKLSLLLVYIQSGLKISIWQNVCCDYKTEIQERQKIYLH